MSELRPCKRPKVTIHPPNPADDATARDWTAAVCGVLHCGWSYANSVKSDVQEQAARHRAQHRNAVPTTSIVRDVEWDVYCEPCGGHRRTFSTRTDAQAWLDYHLSAEHGVVTT